ncbi:hypothetical protein CEXT_706721 [Caerostris extrusa]|uniref:Uncharacterized protein n=1 Tax=Caerostris extrusa TaxID=172846 RepID=A0AAV4PTD3_CAEEX|nr:hypothetical protein CEXT_706721 [Caerostris extrusa]
MITRRNLSDRIFICNFSKRNEETPFLNQVATTCNVKRKSIGESETFRHSQSRIFILSRLCSVPGDIGNESYIMRDKFSKIFFSIRRIKDSD